MKILKIAVGVAIVSLSLAGCGQKAADENATVDAANAPAAAVDNAATQATDDTKDGGPVHNVTDKGPADNKSEAANATDTGDHPGHNQSATPENEAAPK
jgi:hypothetical protein